MRRVCDLDEPFLDRLLQLGLQTEVGDAAVHRDDQLGQLEVPVGLEQLDDVLRLGVKRQPNVLEQTQMLEITCHVFPLPDQEIYLGFFRVNIGALKLQSAESVRRKGVRVVLDLPGFALGIAVLRIADQLRSVDAVRVRIAVHETLVLLEFPAASASEW